LIISKLLFGSIYNELSDKCDCNIDSILVYQQRYLFDWFQWYFYFDGIGDLVVSTEFEQDQLSRRRQIHEIFTIVGMTATTVQCE
jgi:hypothetical protein